MNTRKQVNVMIGLLFIGALATLLYFLWDNTREDKALARQLTENAERGGRLYSLNCRACHGLTGQGSQENASLPGAALNTDANREADAARIRYLTDVIRCGRVGTRMPAWSQEQNGPLNDFQINQLIALITGNLDDVGVDPEASLEGWSASIEEANHGDEFAPPKRLAEAAGANDTTFVLNNARGLQIGGLLRVDDEPEDGVYEVVEIVDAPAGTTLVEEAGADDAELVVDEASIFEEGDIILIDSENLEVTAAPARTALASDHNGTETTVELEDAEGIEADSIIRIGGERLAVISVTGDTLRVERGTGGTQAGEHAAGSTVIEEGDVIGVERGVEGTRAASHRVKREVFELGNEITVARGAFETEATEHAAETEVFNGPIIPPDTIPGGGEGLPPCGQLPARAAAPTAEVQVTGTVDVSMQDNVFVVDGNENPTFIVPVDTTVTFNLANDGSAVHNMRVAGPDGEYDTGDDSISDPAIIPAETSGAMEFSAPAGSYDYECQFHPDQMQGQITVQ
jgi:mono/diheme cytochrome c family protein/plastocyanin